MTLLASKRVRKNFTSQVFGYSNADHQPMVIAFVKADVMMPGDYASFLGRNFTQFDYLNTVLNWSSNDGAGGSNRQYYLGFSYIPAGVGHKYIFSDENGMYFNGPVPINVVSEGTIGSVLIYHTGVTRSTTSIDVPSTPTIPAASATIMNQNYIAIPEADTASNYNNTTATGTGTAFDGTKYLIPSSNQLFGEAFLYNHVTAITNSVSTDASSVITVRSMSISASTPNYLDSIKIKIKEAM